MTYYRICYQKYLLSSDEEALKIFEDHLNRSWFNRCEKWIDGKWVTIKIGMPRFKMELM